MNTSDLQSLPLEKWEPSRLTLQLMCQIVGKVRLKMHPFINHWWHVPLYVSPRGLTSASIPYADGEFECQLDLIDHVLIISTSKDEVDEVRLDGRNISQVYKGTMRILEQFGIDVQIKPEPYKCKSAIPFAEDTEHGPYDPAMVTNAWRALTQIEPVFKKFRSRFVGKCSPVQMFWHSFDLACSRFSGRAAPPMPQVDKVTQEAYSHEVISAGFWFGDDKTPEPAFYCYAAPSPYGFGKQKLKSDIAYWGEPYGSPMALMPYEKWRVATDPESALLEFLQSAYEAGAQCAEWPRLERG